MEGHLRVEETSSCSIALLLHGGAICRLRSQILVDYESGTSSAHGILDCAPAFCTVIDAALLACAIAASRSKSAPRAIAFQRATATV